MQGSMAEGHHIGETVHDIARQKAERSSEVGKQKLQQKPSGPFQVYPGCKSIDL